MPPGRPKIPCSKNLSRKREMFQKPAIDIKDFANNFFKRKHHRKTVFYVTL